MERKFMILFITFLMFSCDDKNAELSKQSIQKDTITKQKIQMFSSGGIILPEVREDV